MHGFSSGGAPLDNAVFVGVRTLDAPVLPSVSVFRPSPSHGRSLARWLLGGVGLGAVILFGARSGLVPGVIQTAGSAVLGAIALGSAALFYRNTKLFVTEEHFGSTNLFGAMRLIPRKLLSTVEAGRDFRFQSADGVTLLLVKPSVWSTSQIRQLSSRLGVPFEVSVDR
jgi:hypothetical protein